jgi:hypothetical protein
MAHQIPYHGDRYQPPNEVIPGNATSDSPVIFHLNAAWGADLARIRSVIQAIGGLADMTTWTPEQQDTVLKAFESAAGAFQNTVARIEGLTVPAAMALRAGLLTELPKRVPAGGGEPQPDPDAPIPVTNGLAFGRIWAAPPVLPMALVVAMKIGELGTEAQIDPRFFAQPSGSGGPGTRKRTASTAKRVRPTSRRRGTADGPAKTGSPQPGTSNPGQ